MTILSHSWQVIIPSSTTPARQTLSPGLLAGFIGVRDAHLVPRTCACCLASIWATTMTCQACEESRRKITGKHEAEDSSWPVAGALTLDRNRLRLLGNLYWRVDVQIAGKTVVPLIDANCHWPPGSIFIPAKTSASLSGRILIVINSFVFARSMIWMNKIPNKRYDKGE